MNGSWIQISNSDNDAFRAYLSLPPSGRGPGIVLLQEIFGINRYIRSVADQYAGEGFVVLAPDLFWRLGKEIELGYDNADRQTALNYRRQFDADLAVADITATVEALRARPEQTGPVAALGFCLGGKLAYLAAAHCGVDAAVAYYGVGLEQQLHLANRIAVPLMLQFAGADAHCPPPARDQIRAAFAGRSDVVIHEYPGADHGFACTERPVYDPQATELARTRTLALLCSLVADSTKQEL